MAKVSILMPACNVEKFIRECMDSVVKQTLEDIEIICLNDGSKDMTGVILDEYAEKYPTVKVIHKPNSGYGHSMNVGLQHATGEYIGVVETDDWAELDMFEKLYEVAKKCDADIVKANYFTYVTNPEPKSEYFEVLEPYADLYNKVFKPSEERNHEVFKVRPCIWSGIYKRQMLLDNQVWFSETPGASYQDTGFAFKAWTSAERAVLVKDAYLHYRIDNANSSVKSAAKIFCICDEYDAIDKYLAERPEKKAQLERLEVAHKFQSYLWNFRRLTMEFRYAFLLQMHKEFAQAREDGLLDKKYFNDYLWKNLTLVLDDMDDFYKKECKKDLGEFQTVSEMSKAYKQQKKNVEKLEKEVKKVRTCNSYKIGRVVTYIPRKIKQVLK